MVKEKKVPETHIHLIISFFWPPKALASIVPKGGESRMGVKKAMPFTP